MSKQKQEIIPKSERVKKVQTKYRLNEKRKMSKESLVNALKNKDDEFYTYYEDIAFAVEYLEPNAFVIDKMKGNSLRFLNTVQKFETPTGPKSVGAVFMTTLPNGQKPPEKPPVFREPPEMIDQKHNNQPVYNFNKYSDFLEYTKNINNYYAIPTTAMLKFDGTEPFKIIKKLTPTINGKPIFSRLLVRYTG